MKMWKKLVTSVTTAMLMFALLTSGVCAAGYTYTVTFSLGNQGAFTSDVLDHVTKSADANAKVVGDKLVVTGLKYGDIVGFDVDKSVNLEGSKYYAKGIRLAGRENLELETFTVTGDQDYVVSYGVKGEQVKYTVKYVHEDGTVLAPDEIFYGNVGDKPVVAFKFLAGYAPKTLGFTKTLSATESENVFKFVYVNSEVTSIKENVREEVTYNESVVTVPGAAVEGTTSNVTGGTASNVTGGGAGNAGAGTEENAGAEVGEETGTVETPEIVDLDDEETPLANIDLEGNEVSKALPMAAYVGMGVLAIIAIIIAVFLTQKFKKSKEA